MRASSGKRSLPTGVGLGLRSFSCRSCHAFTAGHRSSPGEVKEIVATILDLGLDLIPLELLTLINAIEMAAKYKTTVYDSCFLALAIGSDAL